MTILLDGIISQGESQNACRPLPYLSLAPEEQEYSTPKPFSFYHLLLDPFSIRDFLTQRQSGLGRVDLLPLSL